MELTLPRLKPVEFSVFMVEPSSYQVLGYVKAAPSWAYSPHTRTTLTCPGPEPYSGLWTSSPHASELTQNFYHQNHI